MRALKRTEKIIKEAQIKSQPQVWVNWPSGKRILVHSNWNSTWRCSPKSRLDLSTNLTSHRTVCTYSRFVTSSLYVNQHWGERDVTSDKKCDEYCRCHIQNSPSDLPTPPHPLHTRRKFKWTPLGFSLMHTLPLDASCKDDVVFVFLADLGALVEVFLLLTASQIKKHWVNYLVKKNTVHFL